MAHSANDGKLTRRERARTGYRRRLVLAEGLIVWGTGKRRFCVPESMWADVAAVLAVPPGADPAVLGPVLRRLAERLHSANPRHREVWLQRLARGAPPAPTGEATAAMASGLGLANTATVTVPLAAPAAPTVSATVPPDGTAPTPTVADVTPAAAHRGARWSLLGSFGHGVEAWGTPAVGGGPFGLAGAGAVATAVAKTSTVAALERLAVWAVGFLRERNPTVPDLEVRLDPDAVRAAFPAAQRPTPSSVAFEDAVCDLGAVWEWLRARLAARDGVGPDGADVRLAYRLDHQPDGRLRVVVTGVVPLTVVAGAAA